MLLTLTLGAAASAYSFDRLTIAALRMTTPIPCPPSLPFFGHVTRIEKEVPVRSFVLLAKQYGEIFELLQFCEFFVVHGRLGGDRNGRAARSVLVVSSYELMNDVCDDKRFIKNPGGALGQVRNGVGDGLFTVRVPLIDTTHRVLRL